jgi:hypothetical protein
MTLTITHFSFVALGFPELVIFANSRTVFFRVIGHVKLGLVSEEELGMNEKDRF